uniref:Serine carboxypeptidase S28 family protein n=1 Tax=Kalanchoe fedtschenkoi TaxID=63787 RepID=A0A7N0VIL8_KALFE
MVAAAHFFSSVAAAAVLLSFFSWSGSVASLPIRLKKEAAHSTDQEDLCVHKWYTQPVDHFNYGEDSYVEFQHKYAMVDKYWGGPSSPIFAYLEGEDAMSPDVCSETSLVDAYASRFRPLFIFIEHRYYGDSVPFGSRDAAFSNTSTLGFFGAAQAVQDAAELILSLRQNLSAHYSPVIVAGGSYAGSKNPILIIKLNPPA